ncbi:MAG: hypothetical protein Q7T36_01120 [Fluviicoccus sp.]|uniref:hypothetical protein n=1 Tax=Fluviicoccus sp. TaxID=2003552 RepID=UPI0027213EF6|nr:hypothetical protein [Fluviicoccus sp.]MDO8329054.1 hypothetical protein [Fluviicoccus sp.]
MYKSVVLCLALMIGCSQVIAAELDRKEVLVQQVLKAQGVREVIEEMNRQTDESFKLQAQQLYQQVLTSNGGIEIPAARELHNKLFTSSEWLIPVEDITAKWAEAYGRQMTVPDLENALSYYTSAVGQREVTVNKNVSKMLTSWMLQEMQARADKIFTDYMRNMKALLANPSRHVK